MAGSWCFPAASATPDDATLLATALRETHEEVGLASAAIEVLAELLPIRTRTTGFYIAPFLARLSPPPTWQYAQPVIAEGVEIPLRHLTDPATDGQEEWRFPGRPEPELISFWRVGPHYLWGASYRILQPTLPRLLAGGWI